jgi:hypothetical protein
LVVLCGHQQFPDSWEAGQVSHKRKRKKPMQIVKTTPYIVILRKRAALALSTEDLLHHREERLMS